MNASSPPPPRKRSEFPSEPPHPPSARAEATFLSALDYVPEKRDAFVVEACAGDDVLQADVRAMLALHRKAGDFMDSPPGSSEVESEMARLKPEEEGERIGRYKLLQEIGEGGFGTVWMAEQLEPVSRRVALKIIKLGMDTREVIARFEAERQALAMMDHPNIAKVFDAGATEKGRPFFVMELVKGIPITQYCDEAGLGTRQRLALFGDVCSAINHAHQKGVIHRDIKPSNVMITLHGDKAVVKVIDFGIAKATQGRLTEKTLFTRFEQFIGTPVYMSPEQASMSGLDVDTRSDIYALGILLYELLTGKPPFDAKTLASAGYDEMRRIIREVEPPKPSSRISTMAGEERTVVAKARHIEPEKLNRLVEPDLDWIVMKAIDKDRTRRYETANGLAADIRRFLDDELVSARPPTAGYQIHKFARRHKAQFRVAAGIAVVLLAATAVSSWQAVRADREAKAARLAEQRAVSAFDELRATAPAFVEMARGLAAKEQFEKAIEKLDYALKLRPDAAAVLVAKGDLLQCQLKLTEAATIYREAVRAQPGLARAEASAMLCDELVAAPANDNGRLTRESLARLHLAMQRQQRPAAELMPVARLLGEEKKLVVEYWLARLKDLPVSAERPLEKCLTVREDGRLALDLSGTKVIDLSALAGAPLAELNLSMSNELADLSPLRGIDLIELDLSGTSVTNLNPLGEMRSLESLDISGTQVSSLAALSGLRLKQLKFIGCPVSDLSPLQKMPIEAISLAQTHVSDLSPLIKMPVKVIELSMIPAQDFSPLAKLPLEKCYLQRNRIADLGVLRGKPLKELVLWGCTEARNYAAIAEIESLELLMLPSEYRDLPADDLAAIDSLRSHPTLRQLGADAMSGMGYSATGSKDVFWKDWDREKSLVLGLRAAGIRFSLTKLPAGTYSLAIQNQSFRDLALLKGVPISRLDVTGCQISNLAPIRDLPLETLFINTDLIGDLSPLRETPLKALYLTNSKITDLSPLVGLPLKGLYLGRCANVEDVAVLAQITTLEHLTVPIAARNIDALRQLPKLQRLAFRHTSTGIPDSTADEFWQAHGWIGRLREAGIKPRILARQDDGTWQVHLEDATQIDLKILEGAPIGMLTLGGSPDLSPLRGSKMKKLWLTGTRMTDLSPLKGLPLEMLSLSSNTKVSDLSFLRGTPLVELRLHKCSAITDLSALADSKSLKWIVLPPDVQNLDILRNLPSLERISVRDDPNNDFRPDMTAAEFWKEYDEKPRTAQRHARASRWNQARTAFEEAIRLDPNDHDCWYRLAILLAHMDDRAAYRAHCHSMLERIATTNNPEEIDRAAKASLLLPLDDADRVIALRLAGDVGGARDHRFFEYFRYGHAFSEYRAENYESAAAILTNAPKSNTDFVTLPSLVVLALAQQRLGQTVEARVNLAQAETLAAEKLPKSDATDLGRNWNDVLLFRMLLREGRELIRD